MVVVNVLLKRRAFDQRHRKVFITVPRSNLVDRNDAWMIKFGGRFRFDAKPLAFFFARQDARANQFQRDRSFQAFLAGITIGKLKVDMMVP